MIGQWGGGHNPCVRAHTPQKQLISKEINDTEHSHMNMCPSALIEKSCIAGLNRQAGYATVSLYFVCS